MDPNDDITVIPQNDELALRTARECRRVASVLIELHRYDEARRAAWLAVEILERTANPPLLWKREDIES